MNVKIDPLTGLVGLAVLGGLAWFFFRGVRGVAADVAKGGVDVVAGAAEGVTYGVSDAIGIPRTSESECSRALREGRYWDASFACPAGTFLKGVIVGDESRNQEMIDAQTVAASQSIPGDVLH